MSGRTATIEGTPSPMIEHTVTGVETTVTVTDAPDTTGLYLDKWSPRRMSRRATVRPEWVTFTHWPEEGFMYAEVNGYRVKGGKVTRRFVTVEVTMSSDDPEAATTPPAPIWVHDLAARAHVTA